MSSCRSVGQAWGSAGSEACPLCGGSEWVLVRRSDGTEAASPCRCRERAAMARRLRFAELPQAFRDLTLGGFRADAYQEEASRRTASSACRIVKAYLDDFGSQQGLGMGLYIWSREKGSGKTHIAAGIANELLKEHAVKFAVSMAIIQEIKNAWRKDAGCSEGGILGALGTVEVLVVDDFGVESHAGWIDDRFYQIINERYINRLVTIFTSNYPPLELPYDSRIVSRVMERTYQVTFPEESVRRQIQRERQEGLLRKAMGEDARKGTERRGMENGRGKEK